MPWVRKDGKPGLLQQFKLGDVSKNIPDFSDLIEPIEDVELFHALFRDYSYWASAYLVEPCHHAISKDDNVALGRQILPLNISAPLIMISNKIRSKPFMDYTHSYA
jgi:indoleamine 2,3-dioxygenase